MQQRSDTLTPIDFAKYFSPLQPSTCGGGNRDREVTSLAPCRNWPVLLGQLLRECLALAAQDRISADSALQLLCTPTTRCAELTVARTPLQLDLEVGAGGGCAILEAWDYPARAWGGRVPTVHDPMARIKEMLMREVSRWHGLL